MLSATQSLSKDCPADLETNLVVFVSQGTQLGKSVFSVAGLTLPAAKKLTISHEVVKSGEERHLVRNDQTKVDTLLIPATASVYTVIVRPVSTAITNADIIEMVNQLVDFLIENANANVTAILNSEV